MAAVIGNDNNNWLIGTTAADTIKGYGGNDTLKGGGGADQINGGAGIDTALYADSPTGVHVDLWSGRGYYGTAEGDRLSHTENVWGSAYGDFLLGTNGANELRGLDGDDGLYGFAGADVLDGGYGDDFLAGGAGADVLNGGAGNDTASYGTSPSGLTVVLISNSGQGGDAEGDTFIGVENVHGSGFGDHLGGDNNANILFGDYGSDLLLGYDGGDRLAGNAGSDELWGMNGDDKLNGNEDPDRLIGGMGRDELSGGSDADVFEWTSTDETGTTTGTADVILDFKPAERDLIYVGDIDANIYAVGNQAFTFIGQAAFSGTPGEVNYYHLDGDTYIQMQTGQSPDVEGVIRLSGIHTPEASWFVL